MTSTPEATTTAAPATDRPVLTSEVYSLQLHAAAADLHVEVEPVTGRYWLRVGDIAYLYVDRAGLTTLNEQIGQVLA
jgi:hypothetical protein